MDHSLCGGGGGGTDGVPLPVDVDEVGTTGVQKEVEQTKHLQVKIQIRRKIKKKKTDLFCNFSDNLEAFHFLAFSYIVCRIEHFSGR